MSQLSLDECRNFKRFFNLLNQEVQEPPGFRIFPQFLYYLLFYAIHCLEEKKFPSFKQVLGGIRSAMRLAGNLTEIKSASNQFLKA